MTPPDHAAAVEGVQDRAAHRRLAFPHGFHADMAGLRQMDEDIATLLRAYEEAIGWHNAALDAANAAGIGPASPAEAIEILDRDNATLRAQHVALVEGLKSAVIPLEQLVAGKFISPIDIKKAAINGRHLLATLGGAEGT